MIADGLSRMVELIEFMAICSGCACLFSLESAIANPAFFWRRPLFDEEDIPCDQWRSTDHADVERFLG